MNRININIKNDISEEKALNYCFKAKQTLKNKVIGVVTFKDNIVVSSSLTSANNLTFTIYKQHEAKI